MVLPRDGFPRVKARGLTFQKAAAVSGLIVLIVLVSTVGVYLIWTKL